jgi:uncharacterized protein
MHPLILAKRDQLAAACRRHGVIRLDVFGSAARGRDFDPARSDADFLVDFASTNARDHYLDLEEELELILGRKVDLLDRRAIEASRNYIRRETILNGAEAVYAA